MTNACLLYNKIIKLHVQEVISNKKEDIYKKYLHSFVTIISKN
jgi:hypothetical protein